MNNNNDYANLLEIYANMMRKLDYDLTKEQKEITRRLGETLLERPNNEVIKCRKKERVNKYSRKVIANSEFEILRKKKELHKKKISNMSDANSAKDIGKEPGE